MSKWQNCYSGSDNWSQEWQNEMNEKGRKASLQLIQEYPQFNLIEHPHWNVGFDVTPLDYDISIEVKQRTCDMVDITKPQSEKSDIISMYDEHWKGFHCYTKIYNEIAEITSYYKKKKKGKYMRMSKLKFKDIATKDLRELLEPLMSVREKRGTLEQWIQ